MNQKKFDGNKFIQKINERHSITIANMENEIAMLLMDVEQLQEENDLIKEQLSRLRSKEKEELKEQNNASNSD